MYQTTFSCRIKQKRIECCFMFVTHHQKLYYKEYNSTNAPSSIIPNHSAIFWKAVTHKDGTNHYQQWLNFTKDTCFVKNSNATYFGLKITKLLNHCDNVFCSVSCFKQKARGNQIFSLFVSFCVCFSLFSLKIYKNNQQFRLF